jgi:hypothetical protein
MSVKTDLVLCREIDYGDNFLDKTTYKEIQETKEGPTYGLH